MMKRAAIALLTLRLTSNTLRMLATIALPRPIMMMRKMMKMGSMTVMNNSERPRKICRRKPR